VVAPRSIYLLPSAIAHRDQSARAILHEDGASSPCRSVPAEPTRPSRAYRRTCHQVRRPAFARTVDWQQVARIRRLVSQQRGSAKRRGFLVMARQTKPKVAQQGPAKTRRRGRIRAQRPILHPPSSKSTRHTESRTRHPIPKGRYAPR
jgi:hypothetical protein